MFPFYIGYKLTENKNKRKQSKKKTSRRERKREQRRGIMSKPSQAETERQTEEEQSQWVVSEVPKPSERESGSVTCRGDEGEDVCGCAGAVYSDSGVLVVFYVYCVMKLVRKDHG